MKIYDILGKEINLLLNEIRNAGKHSIEFNANNLSSGVYFYKIEAGDFKAVKQMLLLN
ncbi:MAG: T9SS type A sorting domain-containing protein [Ignavibacteria bacterium]|nr:T9SS type A sorting domain-containing protein [Ignavibacteria bacterium]